MKHSIAVVGNPNCGKTTLFNGLTGSSQHIGNWPGVTVEKKSGTLLGTEDVEVVDLPGIYSLNAGSEDETIARNHVLAGETDLVVNITDASNLERNLFLTMTLLEMGKPVLLILNMIDLALRKGLNPDIERLSKELGIQVVAINALNGVDVRNVRRTIAAELNKLAETASPVRYPEIIEKTIESWSDKFDDHPRQQAIMLLEEDEGTMATVIGEGRVDSDDLTKILKSIEEKTGDTADVVIAETKFTYISTLLQSAMRRKMTVEAATDKIDRVVLSKWFGLPVFLGVMYLLFAVVIHIGGAFIDFFDILFGAIFVDGFGLILERIGSPEWLNALLAGGVGAGIQTVATFIPVIFFMFLMLSILEDSGYMARAAFVMDRFMRMIGLPGKAFLPMLVGFGCTVPAVMATRTLENKKDRYLTVFMSPFMSCGARLPVYALFGAAFFGHRASVMVFTIYLMGIALAVLTGLMLKGTLFRGETSPFVMELPPYHAPSFTQIMRRTWNRLKVFLIRAGKVIVIAVLVLAFFNSMGIDGSFGNEDQQKSVLAAAAQAITPIVTPMGVEKENWPATVGLMTGLFAKEAIVGTMSGLYGQMAAGSAGVTGEGEGFSFGRAALDALISIPEGLTGVLGALLDPLGIGIVDGDQGAITNEIGMEAGTFAQLRKSFGNDWTRAYAYLLFVLIYFPCVAAMGAITREIGPMFGTLALVYLTILAWSVATLFFQLATGHNLALMALAVGLVLAFIPVFNIIGGRWTLFGKRRNSLKTTTSD